MTKWVIKKGDVVDVVPRLEKRFGKFDACLCDPPYGIEFMNRYWDKGVPSSDTWRLVRNVLHPGAIMLSFGGTRTFHRLSIAIEDAGFELRDVLCWLYGQGFPKSYNIEKALRRKGHTELAEKWAGYGTALKPAWEPIVMSQKPRTGTYVETVREYHCGVLNIDGARVPLNGHPKASGGCIGAQSKRIGFSTMDSVPEDNSRGRWPANVAHDGSSAIINALPDTESVSRHRGYDNGGSPALGGGRATDENTYGDAGSAARFFYEAKAPRKERDKGCAGLFWARDKEHSVGWRRVSRAEWEALPRRQRRAGNIHPTVKPVTLLEHLATLILPAPRKEPRKLLVPFSGSGSEMIAALNAGWDTVVGIEMVPEYVYIASRRLSEWHGGL